MIYEYPNIPREDLERIRILPRPKGNPGGRKRTQYKDCVCAFDIETTTLPRYQQSIMYIWQWQIGKDITIIGRTWDEFLGLCTVLTDLCTQGEKWVTYIHNASYEFQFIAGIYEFIPEEIFAVDYRKILKFTMMQNLEFRCSYLHSNMSLDQFTRKMGAEHQKLSGELFDYSKIRYPWTKLSDYEMQYCVNDVLGLVEALYNEMARDGDTLYNIPLTSTGYVRRDVRQSMRTYNKDALARQLPTWEIYQMLREGFRGGDTHANRYYTGSIIHDVRSADRSSSYPSCQINDLYPMGKWFVEENVPFERMEELITKRRKAAIMRIAIYGPIRLKDPRWGAPYLTTDKCRNKLFPVDNQNREIWGCRDNGRILFADYLETTVTDVDLRIIVREYDFESIKILKMAYSTYGQLPNQFTDPVKKYFIAKTSLKGVDGREWEYMKAKNKLNSIYGMSVQDPVKDSIIFNYKGDQGGFNPAGADPKELLEESNRKAFTAYSWGVWTTAWARWHLHEMIQIVHDTPGADFIYCDTDSVKYIGDVDLEKYNAKMRASSRKHGAFATDPKGKVHYMGVFEYEGNYTDFVTLGAKKYAVVEEEHAKRISVMGTGDYITLTLAGVNKEEGAKELERAGGLEAFVEGLEFRDGGGTESIYHDEMEPHPPVRIGNHELKFTRNVVITPSVYTLGVTGEYDFIIKHPDIWRKLLDAEGPDVV